MELNNLMKTALVTGASRGIGRETARIFAENKYNVIINYNKSVQQAINFEFMLKEKGFSAVAIKADVSNRNEVNEMVKKGIKLFESIDVLVNNAGIAGYSVFSDISEDDWDEMININLKGVFNCSQEVLKSMIKTKNGKIINLSSIWGMVGASCEVHYSTAKAGIIGFTKALAKEVGLSNIQVNCVAPGVIDTDMIDGFNLDEKKQLMEEIPMKRFGSPEEIAKLIYFIATNEASYLTGQVISPNGGYVI